ncbi:hypothetical protein KR009_003634 [Drosophila setifemur]|nr:hypothetical protein KR009_003634 [Drosophila setifemur]
MTFYWWSHWFWITLLLSVNLLSSHVHTYPSQEAEVEAEPEPLASSPKPVRTTRLFQTTVSQNWVPATQSNIMDLTHRPQAVSAVTPSYGSSQHLAEREQERELEQEQDQLDQEEPEAEVDAEADGDGETLRAEVTTSEELAQFEFKRSADLTSEQLNNFTNFSSSTSTNGSSSIGSSNTTTKPVPIISSRPATPTSTTTRTVAAAEGAGAGAGATNPTTAAVQTTTTTTATATLVTKMVATGVTTSTSTPAGLAATPATPKINTEWLSDELLSGDMGAGVGVAEAEGEKAPFTLENANKEEELRRAESEHRSRKSKVLSAEYKHINRYINFSSDTKSLLTRSASAAPSISGSVFYDGAAGDEGNISSEALAIQRTYFLDAGAISAICFTVFGICCTVGTIGIVLYRRRYLNKPQALSEPDSSVYIDDSTMRVSVRTRAQLGLVTDDNSDEMYSLDNDSFLNSLEAMTIQNYWTDTVKHTKL